VFPFWSPDGTSLGFFAEGKLRTIRLADNVVADVADAPVPHGAAWHPSGDLIFAPAADGPLMRRAVDGAIHPFTALDTAESSHRFPRILDHRHIVFFVRAEAPTRQGIWIAPVDSPAARKRLVNSEAEGLPLDSSLLYASGDALVAQRIDVESLTLDGRPTLLGSPVGRSERHQLFATVGADLLLFGLPLSAARELRWVDRTGARLGTVGEPMNATDVRLDARGRSVVVARVDPQLRTFDIWVYEDERPVPRRLSPAIDADDAPVWSSDGRQVAWVTGRRTLTVRDSAAARPETTLRKFDNAIRVTDWSPDGRSLVVSESRSGTRGDIFIVPSSAAQNAAIRPYAQTPFNETFGTISPDGRWLAYASDESGRPDVYVDSFPSPGRRARLSVGGGTEPRWGADSRTLYFRRGSEVHVVRLETSNATAEALANTRLFSIEGDIRSFDVTSDGQRFLLNAPAPDAAERPLNAIVHVRSLLPSAP
jgi:hypothetical protein